MKKTLALTVISLLLISTFSIIAPQVKAGEAIPTPPYPKFLTLPFQDTEIRILQAWLYNWGEQPNYHYAIDYVKGIGKGRWVTFDVLAAAEGEAKYVGYFPKSKEGRYNYGHLVQVRHPYYDSAGNQFYTLYAHLSEVSGKLAILSEDGKLVSLGWVPVERGEYLGKAGESGAEGSGIHLHFEVQVSES
ncbi:MAG: M23 family metallopeptidase, partial [Thermoproteota archaeon]